MKRLMLTVVVIVVVTVLCSPLWAADEMKLLMWIEGITGPEDQVESWIECAGFHHNIPGLARPMVLLQRGPQNTDFSYQASGAPQERGADLMLVKEVDSGGPTRLMSACQRGTRMRTMKLAFIQGEGDELTTNGMLFTDAIICTTYMVRAPGFGDRGNVAPAPEDRPVEVLGFHLGQARWGGMADLQPLLELLPLLK